MDAPRSLALRKEPFLFEIVISVEWDREELGLEAQFGVRLDIVRHRRGDPEEQEVRDPMHLPRLSDLPSPQPLCYRKASSEGIDWSSAWQGRESLSSAATEEIETSQQKIPPGRDEKSVEDLIAHYENQTEGEELADIEAVREAKDVTLMAIPTELVPEVRRASCPQAECLTATPNQASGVSIMCFNRTASSGGSFVSHDGSMRPTLIMSST